MLTQPGSFLLVRIVTPHLAKLLEDRRLILRCDADARVADRYFYCAISLPGIDSDPASLRRELHRVGQQIEQNLFDLPLIADEVAKLFVDGNVEVDAALGGGLTDKGARVVDRQG